MAEHITALESIYGKKGPPQPDTFGFNHSPPCTALTVIEGGLSVVNPLPGLPGSVHQHVPKEEGVQGNRPVTVLRDHTVDYPDLWLSIFVVGDAYEEAQFAKMFARTGSYRADSILEADLVIFTGGVDVDPTLYGEQKHKFTQSPDKPRDDADMAAYMLCLENGIPMLGICRGAQFLHVMNGGKLIQHLDGHNSDHRMFDYQRKMWLDKVSSVHHQAVIHNISGGMEIIATSSVSTERWFNPSLFETGSHNDIEAFFYRDTCCIGVQGHPEYANYPFFTKWCLELINEYVTCNLDLDWTGEKSKNRRMIPALLEQRKIVIAERGKMPTRPVLSVKSAEESAQTLIEDAYLSNEELVDAIIEKAAEAAKKPRGRPRKASITPDPTDVLNLNP